MKRTFAVGIMTLATAIGCTQGTPGGPGMTDTTTKKPVYGQADDTFNLSVPSLSSTLQQGAAAETTIGIKRAKNFDNDVALTFADVPKGVTFAPASPMIKHGDTDAKIMFTAGDETPLGTFPIKVTGHPTKGGDAQVEFKLTVVAKDSFTLSAPRLSTTLNQGKTQTVSIGVNRQKSFNQDVVLTFGEMPTGVSIEPQTAVIKHDDKDAQFTLTAVDDAALGNFTIKVKGHPTTGADAVSELKLTVVKE